MPEGRCNTDYPLVRHAVRTAGGLFTDIRDRRVPNWPTPLFLTGLLTAGLRRHGSGRSFGALLGVLVMGGPYVFVYIRGGGGAGDAKLMLRLGAWSVSISNLSRTRRDGSGAGLDGDIRVIAWRHPLHDVQYPRRTCGHRKRTSITTEKINPRHARGR